MTDETGNTRSGPYDGNGVATVFAYQFRIQKEAHIKVVVTDASGTALTKVLNSDYTLDGVGNAAGGNVTFTTAPATGEKVWLLLNAPYHQSTDFTNTGAFYAQTVEDSDDDQHQLIKQLLDRLNRVAALKETTAVTPGALVFPEPGSLNSVIGWDESGQLKSLTLIASDDLVLPGSSVDHAVPRFDGTTGKTFQSSVVQVSDAGNVTGVADLTVSGNVTGVADLTMSGNVTGVADLTMSGTLLTDTIDPNTTDAGVTVDGIRIYFPDGFVNSSAFIGTGGSSLSHTTGLEGYYNLGVGLRCLNAITTGSYNTAAGFETMEDLTTGDFNTAFGEACQIYNVSGDGNTSLGWKAMQGEQGVGLGDFNVAVGYSAGINALNAAEGNVFVGPFAGGTSAGITGDNNVLVGRSAAQGITAGFRNVVMGYLAGADITTGNTNTIIGYSAGRGITTGVDNTIIGTKTGLDSSLSNTVIIATGAGVSRYEADSTSTRISSAAGTDLVTISNSGLATFTGRIETALNANNVALNRSGSDGAIMTFARSGATVGSISVTTTNTAYNTSSDSRLKEDVVDLVDAEAVIDGLRPVDFRWRQTGERSAGFIAQELYDVVPGAVTPGIGEPGDPDFLPWGVDYSQLVPFLVAEIKSLRARVAALEGRAP